jgi:pimeloyl-ACP methyl ester carboxylesterase
VEGPIVLYLNEKGKESLLQDRDVLSALLESGARVLALDLRGTGETSPGKEEYFWDFLAGKPIAGQRVSDVLSVVAWLKAQGIPLQEVRIWAHGLPGLWAAVACLRLEPVGGLVLEDLLISFEDVIMTRLPRYNHEILLPGITARLDLPELYEALCPVPLNLINPLRADKTLAEQSHAENVYSRAQKTYRTIGGEERFSVTAGVDGLARSQLIVDALLSIRD